MTEENLLQYLALAFPNRIVDDLSKYSLYYDVQRITLTQELAVTQYLNNRGYEVTHWAFDEFTIIEEFKVLFPNGNITKLKGNDNKLYRNLLQICRRRSCTIKELLSPSKLKFIKK